MTLEILNFGVHCFARTRNLLEIRYPDKRDLQKNIACSLIPGYDQSNEP